MGSPEDIYDKPVNMFVADFIGAPAINFLPGKIQGNELLVGEQKFPLLTTASDASNDRNVTLGIRPLDIQIDTNGIYNGMVDFVEKTGAETHLHLKFADHKIRAVSPKRLNCKRGDTLAFHIESDKIHLFDSKTEQRL